MKIQRFDPGWHNLDDESPAVVMVPVDNGLYIRWDDHLDALKKVRGLLTVYAEAAYNDAYIRAYNEAKRNLLTPVQAEQFDAMMEALDNDG